MRSARAHVNCSQTCIPKLLPALPSAHKARVCHTLSSAGYNPYMPYWYSSYYPVGWYNSWYPGKWALNG